MTDKTTITVSEEMMSNNLRKYLKEHDINTLDALILMCGVHITLISLLCKLKVPEKDVIEMAKSTHLTKEALIIASEIALKSVGLEMPCK